MQQAFSGGDGHVSHDYFRQKRMRAIVYLLPPRDDPKSFKNLSVHVALSRAEGATGARSRP